MNNKELRIGNLVFLIDVPVEITGIPKSGLYFGKHGFAGGLGEWFQPIPITEKWLLQFGITKESKNWYSFKTENCIDEVGKFYIHTVTTITNLEFKIKLVDIFVKRNGEMISIVGSVKYVHQLQNLYFALTQKELKTKQDEKD